MALYILGPDSAGTCCDCPSRPLPCDTCIPPDPTCTIETCVSSGMDNYAFIGGVVDIGPQILGGAPPLQQSTCNTHIEWNGEIANVTNTITIGGSYSFNIYSATVNLGDGAGVTSPFSNTFYPWGPYTGAGVYTETKPITGCYTFSILNTWAPFVLSGGSPYIRADVTFIEVGGPGLTSSGANLYSTPRSPSVGSSCDRYYTASGNQIGGCYPEGIFSVQSVKASARAGDLVSGLNYRTTIGSVYVDYTAESSEEITPLLNIGYPGSLGTSGTVNTCTTVLIP